MWKKFFGFLVLGMVGLFFGGTVQGAVESGEHIQNYRVNISVQENGDLLVREEIVYDFGTEERHGIYRDIPTNFYFEETKKKLQFSDFSVVDTQKNAYLFERQKANNSIRIKIGDPDTLVTGVHTYILSYTVHKPVAFFEQKDTISWNAIGTGWSIPIDAYQVRVELDTSFQKHLRGTACFVGSYGSTTACGENANILEGVSGGPLGIYEGVTVDLHFESGTFPPPTQAEEIFAFLQKWWSVFVPILVFLFLLRKWHKTGRDPKGRATIVTQFDPPDDLTPAEVGTLVDEKAQNKDIYSEIIFLAIHGHIKITKEKTPGVFGKEDYVFERIGTPDQISDTVARELFLRLFAPKKNFSVVSRGILQKLQQLKKEKSKETLSENLLEQVRMSDLKDRFYEDIKSLQDRVFESLVAKGYFPESPKKKALQYSAVGGVVVLLTLLSVGYLIRNEQFVVLGSFLVSGILFLVFAPLMGVKTETGVAAKEHILGFKNYLSVAEKARIDFHNAPEKSPEVFEKFLPFAMALGVETAWAKQFADLSYEPSWYSDGGIGVFQANSFVQSMSSFSSSANKTLGSNPSSGGGGGGFSGGGGGGGGGGSW